MLKPALFCSFGVPSNTEDLFINRVTFKILDNHAVSFDDSHFPSERIYVSRVLLMMAGISEAI